MAVFVGSQHTLSVFTLGVGGRCVHCRVAGSNSLWCGRVGTPPEVKQVAIVA